jgi:uncharacterized membrane protein
MARAAQTLLSRAWISVSDLKYALDKGREDFLTMPSSLFFLALIYPIVGIGLVAGTALV